MADPAGLAPGTHTGEITIFAPGAKNSPLVVPVAFEVTEQPPLFDIRPESLEFSATEGAAPPKPQTLTIDNAGGGELRWTATPSADWMELSAYSGTAPFELQVSVNTAELSPARYSGTILFSADGAEPVTVGVALEVESSQQPPVEHEQAGCSCAATSGRQALLPLVLLGLLLASGRRERTRR